MSIDRYKRRLINQHIGQESINVSAEYQTTCQSSVSQHVDRVQIELLADTSRRTPDALLVHFPRQPCQYKMLCFLVASIQQSTCFSCASALILNEFAALYIHIYGRFEPITIFTDRSGEDFALLHAYCHRNGTWKMETNTSNVRES